MHKTKAGGHYEEWAGCFFQDELGLKMSQKVFGVCGNVCGPSNSPFGATNSHFGNLISQIPQKADNVKIKVGGHYEKRAGCVYSGRARSQYDPEHLLRLRQCAWASKQSILSPKRPFLAIWGFIWMVSWVSDMAKMRSPVNPTHVK